jgi:hypothetical protein
MHLVKVMSGVETCVVCMEVAEFWAQTDCCVGETRKHHVCVCWPCMVEVVKKKPPKCPWCRAAVLTMHRVKCGMCDVLESVNVSVASAMIMHDARTPAFRSGRRCVDCGVSVSSFGNRCPRCFAAVQVRVAERRRECPGCVALPNGRVCLLCWTSDLSASLRICRECQMRPIDVFSRYLCAECDASRRV